MRKIVTGAAVALSLSFAFSLFAEERDLRLISHWRGAFDPAKRVTSMSAGASDRLQLVQFNGHPTHEWLTSLVKAGAELISFFPNAAYLVRMPSSGDRDIRALPFVRAITPWTPEMKFDPESDRLRAGKDGKIEANIILFNPSGSLKTTSSEKAMLKRLDAVIERDGISGLNEIVVATVPNAALNAAAALSNVIAIEAFHAPEPEDESAAFISSGRFRGSAGIAPPVPSYADWTAASGYDGTFVTAVVADTGLEVLEEHIRDRSSDIVHSPDEAADLAGHGTFVAAEINGMCTHAPDPVLGYHYATGVAPWTSVVGIPYLQRIWSASGDPACTGMTNEACLAHESVTAVGTNSVTATLQNDSWGHQTAGGLSTYTSTEQQWDRFVRDADQATSSVAEPLTIIFSAGNDGSQGLTRPHAAKNIITVGASANYFPVDGGYNTVNCATVCNSSDINMMLSCSAWGNTEDGRVKPDLVAPGALVASARVGALAESLESGIDTHHAYAWGTSAAAPLVTGQAALITQKFRSEHRGATPSPAMTKAILVGLADDIRTPVTHSCRGFAYSAFYNLDPATFAFPNDRMGWGRVDTLRYFHSVTGIEIRERDQIRSDTLNFSGDERRFAYHVSASGAPLLITAAWTDKEGAINANPALVNDLDLEVETAGTLYRGNVFAGGKVSAAGGSADRLNNVESVFVPRVHAGQELTVRVRAAAINGDGVPYNANLTDQDFALFVYNACEGSSAPPAPPHLSGFYKPDIGVSLSWDFPDQNSSPAVNLYRAVDDGASAWIGTAIKPPFIDQSVLPGLKYRYFVRQFANCTESKDSNLLDFTILP